MSVFGDRVVTEAKHTELPYNVDSMNNIWAQGKGDHKKVCDMSEIPKQSTVYDGMAPEENIANAVFIVRACNSHYELLKALEPFAQFACSPVGECDCHNCRARDAIQKAKA